MSGADANYLHGPWCVCEPPRPRRAHEHDDACFRWSERSQHSELVCEKPAGCQAAAQAAQTRALETAIKKALRLFSIKPNETFMITALASPAEQAEIYDVLRAALTGAPREPA